MKKILFFAIMLSVAALGVHASDLTLTSADIAQGKTLTNNQVFNGFGCSGDNISPQLAWENAPKGTKSFAITVYDPDAPTGSGWWHWVAFNIPPSTTAIVTGASGKAMPAGTIESITDFGSVGFGGACPPKGSAPHRYQFTVWALNVDVLPLDAQASGAKVGYFLHQHAVDKATLEAVYGR